MKNLLLTLSVLFIAVTSIAQLRDFATYELVIRRGNVSIIRQDDEYRMIVGSQKRPRINLLLGTSADQAANQVERIRTNGKKDDSSNNKRIITLCGESFLLSVSGKGDSQKYIFRKPDESTHFSLSSNDVNAIVEAIHN